MNMDIKELGLGYGYAPWYYPKVVKVKNVLYRVSQKKLSLVEIACGKYNSNIGEKSSRSFDKSW